MLGVRGWAPLRFIPACAGNHPSAAVDTVARGSSPHARGTQSRHPVEADSRDGSSPHARGTLREPRTLTASPRFIPACAGNTSIHRCIGRSCSAGSSPHARGTLTLAADAAIAQSVHPRMRGEHCDAATHALSRPVHPRMRGEHGHPAVLDVADAGSSPHARGTRSRSS